MNNCKFCSNHCEGIYCSLTCVGFYSKHKYKIEYNIDPKKCKQCDEPLPYESRNNKFCNRACAATYNNTGRVRSLESKLKTSLSLKNKAIDKPLQNKSRKTRNRKEYFQNYRLRINLSEWNWMEIQEYYNSGHGTRDCERKFHRLNNYVWQEAKKAGLFISRPPVKFNLQENLVENNKKAKRDSIKRELVAQSIVPNECAECGQELEWNGKRLVFVLDHINGVNDDYRVDNLRLLCPNCNSQTDTFCRGSKSKKKPVRAAELSEALLSTDSIRDALELVGMDLTANSYSRVSRMLAKLDS